MTQIQQNRYDQLLRRVADLKGTGSKVNDALTELFPMFDVENMPAELLLLAGTRLCMGEFQISPVATFFNQAVLRNPANSGAILTVLEIRLGSTNSQQFVLGPTLNTLGTVESTAFIDGRVFGQGTVGQLRSANNILVPGSTFYRMRIVNNSEAVLNRPEGFAVLSPGTGFSMSSEQANTNFTGSILWKERVAQPSELNL